MLSRLGRNLRAFLWALVLGLSVWVAAVTAADPDEVRLYPNAVSLELVGQDPGLVITSDVPKDVQLTLRAPRSVWDQLTARPESVRAILDLVLAPHRTYAQTLGSHCAARRHQGRKASGSA